MFKFFKLLIIKILYLSIQFIEKIEYKKRSLNEYDISKKILNSLKTNNLKILSDTGYEPVSQLHITQPYTNWFIKTNNFSLICADNHIIFDKNYQEVFVKDLKIGDSIQTLSGIEEIISIKLQNFKSSMFDATIDHPNHRFYTNGILSHNTICSSIMMLHYVLFNNNKNVLVTANKLDTAVEVLDKIREIYQKLPFFLQQGIINWNQKFMVFENKSRIKGFATTKTSSIGQSADFLYLDEFAYLPDNIADKFYKSVFPTVSNIDNSKIIITSTPNGFNLFHRLLSDAEKPDGEKSSYIAKRVYWWQVPKRFATYIRINKKRTDELNIDLEKLLEYLREIYPKNQHNLSYNEELKKWVITTLNNSDCTEEDILSESYMGIRFLEFSEITTWKKETIKDIGGEEAFNQEYDLRFINSSRSILSEHLIDDLTKGKKPYEWEKLDELEKLKFSYQDLKWVQDDEIFMPIQRKKLKIIISVDISEGLGQDYSVINIFKISPKTRDLIEEQKHRYKNIVDFFRLEQIGVFRNNLISVSQLAELLYLIAFEYFNPDNVKIVLEINTYGNELLAHLPHVFDGKNDYGSSIFFRFKHRSDSIEEKIGLKLGDNKNLLVKEYQERMEDKCILVTNDTNIQEMTTFIKHTTNAGNVRYAADGSSNDDLVMSIVDMCAIFQKNDFKQIIEEFFESLEDKSYISFINESLNQLDFIESVDYSQVLNIRRKNLNRYKNNSSLDQLNGFNPFKKNNFL
jgi:hypothetical protein